MELEEVKQLTEADHIDALLQSEGWKIIYPKLTDLILDLQNIANIDMEKPDTLNIQIAARKMATDLIMAWLKGSVFGFVEQQKANAQKEMHKVEDYIGRE